MVIIEERKSQQMYFTPDLVPSSFYHHFITHLIQNILLNLAGDKDTGAVLCNVVISGDQVRPGCVIII